MNPKNLLIAALLATLSFVSQADHFSIYKLSLIWPPSICLEPDTDCVPRVLNSFKIQGLWPAYADNDVVPPYDPSTNRCTNVNPATTAEIVDDLATLHERLTADWPNAKDFLNKKANENTWKFQWSHHGMCSDYPTDPYTYFISALDLFMQYKNPFYATGIEPRTLPYTAKQLSEAIQSRLGVYPEIACNKVKGDLLLREVRICVKRDLANPPHVLQDCPKRYAYNCHYDDDDVRYVNYPYCRN